MVTINEVRNVKKDVDVVYGLLFVELDSLYGKRNFVAAYGSVDKVKRYQEEFNLKGDYREYKTQSWLVKRLESIKSEYKDSVRVLFIE